MDPLSALGLASSFVQFVGIGYNVISYSIEYHKSTKGALNANDEIEILIKLLDDICESLRQS